MANILSQSATRIKTGVALLIGLSIIGFIDSIPLTWLLFGGLMLIALKEAMKNTPDELQVVDAEKVYFNLDGELVVCVPLGTLSDRIIVNGANLEKIKSKLV